MSNGNFAGGDGTTSNPYLIEDAADLNAVRNNLTASYKLINDIDLNISPYNEGEGWTPIGNGTNNFTGVFDGNGYIVKNLFINSLINYVGFFGLINNAIIKNIRLENVNINAAGILGGLVGYAQNSSSISNSSSTGVIIGNGNKIGGLVGSTYSNVIISNSYSMCSTTGGSSIGGLVGYNSYSSSIFNSYSTGIVNGTNKVGGLIGENYNSTVTNSYWDEETSGQSVSAGGTGLTTAQMKTASSFVNWNTQLLDDGVTHIWVLKDGEYPKLWFEEAPAKFLIMQNNEYYSIQNNVLTELGIPMDDGQKKEWFSHYGVDDLKEALLISDENGNKLIDSLENKFKVRMMRPKN